MKRTSRCTPPAVNKNAAMPTFVPAMADHPTPPADDPRTRRLLHLGHAVEDFYFTPEGYVVWTETYHLKRGYCCQSGCRHCPYGNSPADRKKNSTHR